MSAASAAQATGGRSTVRTVRLAADVLGSWPRRVGFVLAAALITGGYTLLLPFEYTQRLGWRNWQFLTGRQLAWSIVLGLGMAFVLTVQAYAMRQIAAGRHGTLTGLALLGGLLPSFLCCTPIIPTLLAFIGISTVTVYGTTGTLQHFFAVYQTDFFLASLALLTLSGWWALRRLARATCWTDEQCDQSTASTAQEAERSLTAGAAPAPEPRAGAR